ncbi:hypothetical protein PPL_09096 [Heterostelium album PN500]|uniref:Uncharacterized protein n=1 Tax=Heterostelium pallidum (strain ATCC 26659 / Pp 5 / PN500) TaxID=670386 RepID=D3BKL4_HETP5|nr:hypothetical protein PPL_09096 [Heterostelium album PN500]EFA78444.1 hypothetical protein PPL_09096 [Heterostelium album PN500]|eukprot:XP_020430569.1 hypothetical protein PPL_09096 [Heterostelium album PN500]
MNRNIYFFVLLLSVNIFTTTKAVEIDSNTLVCVVNTSLQSCQSIQLQVETCPSTVSCISYLQQTVQNNPSYTTTVVVLADGLNYNDCPGTIIGLPESYIHVFVGGSNSVYQCNGPFANINLSYKTDIVFEGFTLIGGGYSGSFNGGLVSVTYSGVNGSPNLEFVNTTISEASVKSNGGCIYSDGMVVSVINSTIFSCIAQNNGGAIATAEGSDIVTITNSNISMNTAYNYAGAIYASILNVNNSTFSENTGAIIAGALYVSNFLSIQNSTFYKNVGSSVGNAYGGAIYFNGQMSSIVGTKFIQNIVLGMGSGGSIYANYLTLQNCEFSDDSAYYGGSIYSISSLNMENCTLVGSRATMYGGAIFANGNVNIRNSSFTGSTAYSGGAIYTSNAGYYNMIEDSQFFNNVAKTGGAIYSKQTSSYYFSGSLFNANSATIQGGAMYFGGGGYPTMLYGGKFIGNTNKVNQLYDTFNSNVFSNVNTVNVSTDIITSNTLYSVPLVIDNSLAYPVAYGVLGECYNGIATITTSGQVTSCQCFPNYSVI